MILLAYHILNTSTKKDNQAKEQIKEVQGEQHEEAQPLPKNWRYTSSHPKELIINDVSKGVSTWSKLHDICGSLAFISHIEPKNIHKAELDSYWLFVMQEELNQLECKQV